MIYLALTTDKLALVTTSTATLDVQANFIDASVTTGVVSGIGKQNTAIATATTTDVLAAPGASTARTLKQMTVRNKSATLPNDVTVIFNQNGTLFEIHKVTLNTGDTLEYIEGVGFFTLTSTAKYGRLQYVTANSVHATAAALAAITGLSFDNVKSGKVYQFLAHLYHRGDATTTGAQFAVGGVAMTGMNLGAISGVTNSVTAAALSTGVVTAVDTIVVVQTTSSITNVPTILSGYFQPSADGTFIIKATSEVTVAAGLTILKGSWAMVRETDN